jgi:hypothetical protein
VALSTFPFPRLFGRPTRLDLALPKLCCNCGVERPEGIDEVSLYINHLGMRVVTYPGFTMDVPLCSECERLRVTQPVTLSGARRRFLSGSIRQVSLRFRNRNFADAFRNLNRPLVTAGWLVVIHADDGGVD